MLEVLLVGKGIGRSGSVFASLVTVRSWRRCRRALLREEGYGLSFLIPCDGVPMNDQSTYTTSVNGFTYFCLLTPSVAAQLFGCLVSLDVVPY